MNTNNASDRRKRLVKAATTGIALASMLLLGCEKKEVSLEVIAEYGTVAGVDCPSIRTYNFDGNPCDYYGIKGKDEEGNEWYVDIFGSFNGRAPSIQALSLMVEPGDCLRVSYDNGVNLPRTYWRQSSGVYYIERNTNNVVLLKK